MGERGLIWTMLDGTKIALEDMDYDHKKNVLALLRRRAPTLKFQYDMKLLTETPMPNPDTIAYDMVERALDEEWEIPPEVWIEDHPYVVRLKELIEEDEKRTDFWNVSTTIKYKGKRYGSLADRG